MKGLSNRGNLSFNIETSYWYPDCPVFEAIPGYSLMNYTDTYQGWFWNGLALSIFSGQTNYDNTTSPRAITLESFSNPPDDGEITTRANCSLKTSYVECQVQCNGNNCSVVALRNSTLPAHSTSVTSLDLFEGTAYINFFIAFINSTGVGHEATLSPLEMYLTDPESAFAVGEDTDDWPSIFPIGRQVFEQRFAQLMNSYYFAGIQPNAITGNFSNPGLGDAYQVQSASGTLRTKFTVLTYNRGWLATLILASLVMLLLGIVGTVLNMRRRSPDVLDSFSLAIRYNVHVELPDGTQVSSMVDGVEFSRKVRNLKVRLGDVHSEREIGMVAISNKEIGGIGATKLRQERLYE